MKTLLKLFIFVCLLTVIALVAGYFVLTNPGFQKSLVEKQLPEGSSIEHVQVTLGSFELRGLKMAGEDGTLIEVGTASSAFSPLAAWREQTIELGELVVSGVRVDLPEVAAAESTTVTTSPGNSPSGASEPAESSSASPSGASEPKGADSAQSEASPFEAIYQLGELDWLFDIERIHIDGELSDGQGGNYAFKLESSAISPSMESTVQINLDSAFDAVRPNGLKAFNGAIELSFSQKVTGGFERFQLEVEASAQDEAGANLLSFQQSMQLEIQSAAQTAGARVELNAEVPEPQRFMPELAQIGALKVAAKADAQLAGEVVTVSEADLNVVAGGQPIVALDLKKTLTLGDTQNLEGELLDLSLMNLPVAWLSPWMPEGLVVSAEPLSMQLGVSGETDGAMVVEFADALKLTNLSVAQDGEPLVDQLNFSVHPLIMIKADQSVHYRLDQLQLDDRYGTFVSGNVNGRIPAELATDTNIPAGLSLNADMELKLQPLMQQPVMKGKASIMNGTMVLDATVDSQSDYPIQLQSSIQGLRARGMPGSSQNYRFAVQVKQPSADSWQFGVNFAAGNASRPSTDAQLSGRISPESTPLSFELDLDAERIRQSDLSLLAAAFSPSESEPSTKPVVAKPTPSGAGEAAEPKGRPGGGQPSAPVVSNRPAWADLDGKVDLKVDLLELESRQEIKDLTAKVRVSEPLLDVSDLSAVFGDGTFDGIARVDYSEAAADVYQLKADLNVKQLDPTIFASPRSGSYPLRGRFDASVRVEGKGATFEDALDKSESALSLMGKDGVLTAFQLDERKSQALGLIGIAGHFVERPGLTAMTNVVPYFREIRFSDLVVNISRGLDQRVVISNLDVVGEYLLLEGKGSVAPTSWKDLVNKPMSLNLALGSRGRMAEYVDTLNLLQEDTAENGFNYWDRELNISGTLSDPDTSAIMDLLKDAASSALSDPDDAPKKEDAGAKDSEADSKAEAKESEDEEKEIDEVELGLEIINSLFGN